MAFTKKEWVNVPDPSNPPSIPEGQDALARFDADNMNRIEAGINDAHIMINTKAPDGHGLGNSAAKQDGSFSEAFQNGCGFYQMRSQDESPDKSKSWFSIIQNTRAKQEGAEAGIQLAFLDQAEEPMAWFRTVNSGKFSDWLEIIHAGNAFKMFKSISGGENIVANADLNTYTTVGNYICSQSKVAAGLLNCPVSSAFTMTVGTPTGTDTYRSQEVIDYNTGVKYYRVYAISNNTWTSWKATYGTANKPTPEDIGAAPAYSYGTSDLEAGTSKLETGKLYFVYE